MSACGLLDKDKVTVRDVVECIARAGHSAINRAPAQTSTSAPLAFVPICQFACEIAQWIAVFSVVVETPSMCLTQLVFSRRGRTEVRVDLILPELSL